MPRPPFTSPDYVENLSQQEKLDWYAQLRFACQDDQESRIISRPPDGFRMPSMSRVREHDARLSLHGSACNVSDSPMEEDESDTMTDDDVLRDHAYAIRAESMKEHSFRLPSQRSRRDVTEALRFMGMSYHD